MQQRHKTTKRSKNQRIFSASEVGAYEYCALSWWYDHYEPLAQADNEDLFAHLVALEHENGPQATALPDYQVAEQLLVRRGAFAEGLRQHAEHAGEVAALIEDEDEGYNELPAINEKIRIFTAIMLGLVVLSSLCILLAFLLTSH